MKLLVKLKLKNNNDIGKILSRRIDSKVSSVGCRNKLLIYLTLKRQVKHITSDFEVFIGALVK